MPRAPKLSAEEFARRSPGAKGIYRTSKKGQKFFIAFDILSLFEARLEEIDSTFVKMLESL